MASPSGTCSVPKWNRSSSAPIAVHLFINAFPSGWMKTIMDCERRPKLAFYAYREACATLMIRLRCDHGRSFAGETMPIEIWVCNDTHEVHEGARLAWRVRQGERILSNSPKTGHFSPDIHNTARFLE